MKVLITGATGLVGQEIVKLLLQNGVSVNYLTTSKSKLSNESNYKGFYWNITTGEINILAFEDVTVIIHLAGANVAKRWTKSYKQEIVDSRINSAKLLFSTLSRVKNNVSQFISASAVGIYPSSTNKVYHEEDEVVDNSFLGNVVQKWEKEGTNFENLGIKVVKIRIGIVLAKNGGALQEMANPIKYGVGAAFGLGNQYQSWIHIDDLANIFLFAITNKLNGVFNAVSPYPVSNAQLTKAIAKKISKPLFLPNIPKFVMKLILGEMHQILFTSQNVSSKKLLNKGFQFKYAALDKALQNLV